MNSHRQLFIKSAPSVFRRAGLLTAILPALCLACVSTSAQPVSPGERISLNAGWRFGKDDPTQDAGKLAYPASKNWVDASGSQFTTNAELAAKTKPEGDPGGDISCAQNNFDDSQWRLLNLPHDWGIEGPFKQ